jgi:hypothetical protein
MKGQKNYYLLSEFYISGRLFFSITQASNVGISPFCGSGIKR